MQVLVITFIGKVHHIVILCPHLFCIVIEIIIYFMLCIFLGYELSFCTKELIIYFVSLRYAALAPLYYRGAGVAVIVYDITSPESFTKAQYWVKVLSEDYNSVFCFCLREREGEGCCCSVCYR